MAFNESDDAMPLINGGLTLRLVATLLAAGLLAGCAFSDEKAASLVLERVLAFLGSLS